MTGVVVLAAGALVVGTGLSSGWKSGWLGTISSAVAAFTVMLSVQSSLAQAALWSLGLWLLIVRWMTLAPGGATLTAGRAVGLSTGAFLAVTPFLLDVGAAGSGARTDVIAGLLAVSFAVPLGLLPVGGWAIGVFSLLPRREVLVWIAVVVPAAVLSLSSTLTRIGDPERQVLTVVLLVSALTTAVWSGVGALRVQGADRYLRCFVADVALAVVGIVSATADGRKGALLIVIGHICLSPLLFTTVSERIGRYGWLLLSGLPFSPFWWARLLVVEACFAHNGFAVPLTLLALFVIGIASCHSAVQGWRVHSTTSQQPLHRFLAYGVVVVATVVGIVPLQTLHLLQG